MPADEVTAMVVASVFNHATHPEADMELITRARLSRRGRSGDESCATDRLLAEFERRRAHGFSGYDGTVVLGRSLLSSLDWASREAMY